MAFPEPTLLFAGYEEEEGQEGTSGEAASLDCRA